ncbi:nucleotidyl transferase AbiEii/AbiGii toxin family protein [Nocardioides sp. NPDC057577]|uniref:nucleotidyl transferase AbiEii/AbiGii toxin family protein n=1 Tax=Nocardioides sp. NPDC057577 TaxID=3346171 RepID=UPI003671EC80
MPDLKLYGTPAGVEAAVKEAARAAAVADPSLTVNERIRLAHFQRFLSRVFSEGQDSAWILKGGTGMLARLPSTRSTLDIDLYRETFTLDQALEDLRRLAEVDLGDHFRFVYTRHQRSIGGEEQAYTDGYRVSFDVYIGAQRKSRINIDLAVGVSVTAPISSAEPANGLALPRLLSFPYRLYPVVDQIADKVCATMATYNGRPSSREKDLVDLIVLATTQEVSGRALQNAIAKETRLRQMEPANHFAVPATWGAAYAKMARAVPYCSSYRTVEAAGELAAAFIDPALNGSASGSTWLPATLSWQHDNRPVPNTGDVKH